jgi:hypothetical protein
MKRNKARLQPKAKANLVQPLNEDQFEVTSATSGNTYLVERSSYVGFICTCRWSEYHDTRTDPCSHVLAVKEYEAEHAGRTLSLWASAEDAARQHRPTEQVGIGLWTTSRARA